MNLYFITANSEVTIARLKLRLFLLFLLMQVFTSKKLIRKVKGHHVHVSSRRCRCVCVLQQLTGGNKLTASNREEAAWHPLETYSG